MRVRGYHLGHSETFAQNQISALDSTFFASGFAPSFGTNLGFACLVSVHHKSSMKEEGRRKKEEGRRKKEEGRRKKEEGRRKKEEGRRKKEEGRRKKGEGRRRKGEGRRKKLTKFILGFPLEIKSSTAWI
jgi:hypothetical protein